MDKAERDYFTELLDGSPFTIDRIERMQPEHRAALGNAVEGIKGMQPGEAHALYTRTFNSKAYHDPADPNHQLALATAVVAKRRSMGPYGTRKESIIGDENTAEGDVLVAAPAGSAPSSQPTGIGPSERVRNAVNRIAQARDLDERIAAGEAAVKELRHQLAAPWTRSSDEDALRRQLQGVEDRLRSDRALSRGASFT